MRQTAKMPSSPARWVRLPGQIHSLTCDTSLLRNQLTKDPELARGVVPLVCANKLFPFACGRHVTELRNKACSVRRVFQRLRMTKRQQWHPR